MSERLILISDFFQLFVENVYAFTLIMWPRLIKQKVKIIDFQAIVILDDGKYVKKTRTVKILFF